MYILLLCAVYLAVTAFLPKAEQEQIAQDTSPRLKIFHAAPRLRELTKDKATSTVPNRIAAFDDKMHHVHFLEVNTMDPYANDNFYHEYHSDHAVVATQHADIYLEDNIVVAQHADIHFDDSGDDVCQDDKTVQH